MRANISKFKIRRSSLEQKKLSVIRNKKEVANINNESLDDDEIVVHNSNDKT